MCSGSVLNRPLNGELTKEERKELRRFRYLARNEIGELLELAEGSEFYPGLAIIAYTGMRRGEVLGLRWSDVDLDGAVLTVAQALEQTKAGIGFKGPKTESSERTITLPAVTVEALRVHKAEQAKERLALGLGKSNTDLVFTLWDGEVVNPKNFTKEFGRKAKKAGFPEFTFHGWRHSHATSLLKDGVNVKGVSSRLGHSKIAITLDTYGHVLEEQETDVAERIDNIFGAKT